MLVFAYGTAAYLLFLATFLYAVGFIGSLGLPTALDGPADGPLRAALAVDAALLAVFALQHSVMARPAFKRWWTRIVPPSAERSTYVLATNLALLLLFWQWRPMGGVVWDITTPALRLTLHAVCAAGWLTVLVSTFLINHFDLFGLRQGWLCLRGRRYTPLVFRTPGPYRLVRHPLYVGWLLAFWATPTMTAAHLLFALLTAGYILVAIQLEEADLIRAHGDTYRGYRERVGMLLPRLRRRPEPRALSGALGARNPLA